MFDNIVHFDNKYWKVNLEIFLVAVSIGLLLLYHLILKCVSHFAPHRISLKKDLLVRMRWVVKNMQDPTGMTASVQILRNFVIVASFLASTNSVIAVWVASYIIDRGNTEIPILDFTPSATNQTLLQVKLCVIVFILLVSIACFTVSMRNDIHLSSLLQISGDSWGVGLEDGVNCIHHSTCSFWAGTRLYFIFFPFLAYVLGPTWMFCATLITLPVLFSQDYLPRAPAAKKLQFYETMDQLEQLRGNPFEAFVPSSVMNRNTTTPAPVPPILTPTAGNPYGVGLEESSPLIQRNKETLRV